MRKTTSKTLSAAVVFALFIAGLIMFLTGHLLTKPSRLEYEQRLRPNIQRINPPNSILFIGNSFTYFNHGVDFHLKKLLDAAIPSNTIQIQRNTFGGESLKGHYTRRNSLDVISGKNWDAIVLQGHSNEPIWHAHSFNEYAKKLTEHIQARGASTVFFMTWAYEGKPEMTQPLSHAYIRLANQTDSLVVPVGLAWQKALEHKPELNLYSDNKHPSQAGTYLAACVFYAALYQKNPQGNSFKAGLPNGQAEFLQAVAWQVVGEFYRGDRLGEQ